MHVNGNKYYYYKMPTMLHYVRVLLDLKTHYY